jgi:hypothetical protein
VIYDFPEPGAAIRQGDIFLGLPRVDLSLKRVIVVDSDETVESSWRDLYDGTNPISAIISVRPVAAIVISQDCDAARSPDISLCEIRPFQEVERRSKETKAPKSWQQLLTQHARVNQKWFYLPPDPRLGFASKMGVDFLVTLRVSREELEEFRDLRKGRLNDTAEAHFRERLGEFYRRYPYDEWYALSPEELKAYQESHPEATPCPWQLSGPSNPPI